MRTAARCPLAVVWGTQQLLNPVRGGKPQGFQAHKCLRTYCLPAAQCRELITQLGPLQPRRVFARLREGVQCHSVPGDPAPGARLGQESLNPRTIAAGEVHIYWLDPNQVPQQLVDGPYLEVLSREERAYVEAGGGAALRRERLLSRVLLRTTLAAYCCGSVGAEDLQFGRGPQGKPEVWAPTEAVHARSGLHFNVSHTSGLQGCAVSRDALVGLDIESEERHMHGDPLRLARRFFSPAELAELEGVEGGLAGARTHFLRLWTLKEAYVKALGRGIRAAPGLRSFSVSLPTLRAPGAAASNGSGGGSATVAASSGGSTIGCSSQAVLQDVSGAGNATTEQWADARSSREATHLKKPSTPQAPHSAQDVKFSTEIAGEQSFSWQFALLRPCAQHTAAVCLQRLPGSLGRGTPPGREPHLREVLSMWRTIPLAGDEAMTDYDVLACS